MKKSSIFFLFSIFWINLFGQVTIGNSNTPNSNVILDLTNSDSKGLQLNSTTTPPTAPVGNIVFDNIYNMLSLVDTSGKVNLLSPWNYDPSAELIIYLKDGLDVGLGTSIPNTKLHIIGSTPASKLGGGGFFKLGGNDQHIVMDNTKIISKSNGVTESDLQLQEEGHLNVGNHFTTNVQDNTPNLSGPVPSGGIIMWSGYSGTIPTGWKICDGTDNTPNLSGRFIVGIGSTVGGAENYPYGNNPNNNGIGGENMVTLTKNQMPSHIHSNTVSNDSHTHGLDIDTGGGGTSDPTGLTAGFYSTDNAATNGTSNTAIDSDTHNHTVTLDSKGGDASHENRPKFWALAYIMKK
ncbi:hypothetical protein PQZ52_00315 [Flavobacteriales bacterium]|jgi:microcystin-dependent protein|nr:hypothetical protein [Flavobacteriales bacterium]|tara:strand:+ start:143 stop:1192 length:1050 start_codon:yes stop_codon:yes gene_type:complete